MNEMFRMVCGVAIVACAAACEDQVPVGGFEGGGGNSEGGGPEGGAPEGGGAEGGGGSSSSGQIRIHLASTTEPFAHSDGLSGQTPQAHQSGIRSLTLLREEGDPEPLVVFDFGQESVPVDFADGSDTIVYTADTQELEDGVFTIARVVHSWVTYEVDATMHASGLTLPGKFTNFQALSDGSLYEGELYDSGDYDYLFTTGGMDFPASGTGAPVPEWDGGGGFSVVFEDGEWAYYFPVNLPIDTDLPGVLDITLRVNMHESFRWQDQTMPDYAEGVFDTTPSVFEPVLQFGANSFEVTLD